MSATSRVALRRGNGACVERQADLPVISLVIVSAVNDALRQLGAGDRIPAHITARTRELANDPLATMSRIEFEGVLLDVRDTMREPALGSSWVSG